MLIQGATAQHSFAFANAGRAPLAIRSVTTSCGCTAAAADAKPVPPGGRSEIRVTYDSHGKMGEFQKLIVVRSNDPEEPVVHLSVKGLVMASAHPDKTGPQNLFQGSCRACHTDRGADKTGEELFKADCAMCHEHHKMGGTFIAPGPEDMAARPAGDLRRVIAEGRADTSMPAFAVGRGGPLTEAQISSLVDYLRSLRRRP